MKSPVLRFAVKLALTVGAFYLLLSHKVTDPEGHSVSAFRVILDFLPGISLATFLRWVFLAALVKFVGILASMARWQVLLAGQGIELPFRHIFGSFLIGRFLGTFLPSTIGLDGYKLYDAARFSGRSIEASGATLIEKVIGFTGIFLTYLVAYPFGVAIFRGTPFERFVPFTLPIAALPVLGAFAVFVWPGPRAIDWALSRLPLGPYAAFARRLGAAVTAYRGKAGTLGWAALLSFVVHFTTAAMYFFTALAIGVTAAQVGFWEVTYASSIQILATVLSPFTIAGEGIREIAQYYLLGHRMGPAESIVSAALGFWAAEGLTLFGGLVWWARSESYRPSYCRVDGAQVDYEEAARRARDLGVRNVDEATGARRFDPIGVRLGSGLALGAAGGLVAAALLGIAEALVVAATGGAGEDLQVLWYGPLLYGAVVGLVGAGAGFALGVVPAPRSLVDRAALPLGFLAAFLPLGLAVTLFRLRRDVYLEQRPPLGVLLGVVAGGLLLAAALAGLLALIESRRRARGSSGALAGFASGAGLWVAVAVVGAGAAALLSPGASEPSPVRGQVPAGLRERPNVVLVIVDTLRADHLGAYGDGRGLTPHIDAFAREATVYHGMGQASWTKPSIATILTSLYPSSHGAMSKTAVLPEVTTLADVFHQAGYTTGGFVSNVNLAPSFNFQQGFDSYTYFAPDYLFGASESSSRLVLYSILRKVYFTLSHSHWVNQYYQDSETVNAAALPWIRAHGRDRFFALVHYMDPHDPYFRHPYDGYGIARVENPDPPPERAGEMRELYAGEVRHVDQSFGELVRTLHDAGIWDDTMVVLTADHGEEFQDHGGWWHGTTLYEELIGVPLIVKWPHGRVPSRPPRGRGRLLDVAPTIVAAAGLGAPATWQGADLSEGAPSDRVYFAEEDHEGNVLAAVQSGAWKMIRANPGNPRGLEPVEVYDLDGDPRESRNLAGERPSEVARLDEALEDVHRRAGAEAVASGGEVKMDEATRERLRALGYIR